MTWKWMCLQWFAQRKLGLTLSVFWILNRMMNSPVCMEVKKHQPFFSYIYRMRLLSVMCVFEIVEDKLNRNHATLVNLIRFIELKHNLLCLPSCHVFHIMTKSWGQYITYLLSIHLLHYIYNILGRSIGLWIFPSWVCFHTLCFIDRMARKKY